MSAPEISPQVNGPIRPAVALAATESGSRTPSALWPRSRDLAVALIPVVIWFAPLRLAPQARHGLAISAFMIGGWILEVADYAITGLVGCFLFWSLHVVNIRIAFGGFADPTSWFIFAALLLGAVATKTGIAARVANVIMRRFGSTYARVLLGLIVTSFLLTLIVPSGISRIAIMAAMTIGLIEAFGLEKGDNVARGMFLVSTYSAALFDKFMIAGAASITARGIMATVGGVHVTWSLWFAAYAPCDVLVILSCWWFTLKLFPNTKNELEGGRAFLDRQARAFGPISAAETRAAILLVGALVFWVTDFLHHIPPAVIGLGVGLIAVIPRVGLLTGEDLKRINLLPFLFVASALGMADVLVKTKALNVVTGVLFTHLVPAMTSKVLATTVLYWSAFIYHFPLASELSMVATSMPALMVFARAHDLDPKFVGLVWAFAAGGKLFAYQSAVLVIGYSYGYFRSRDLIVLGSCLTVAEFVFLVPTVCFYWPLIGIGTW